jgi:NAD(P)H dehydrogenase (quinone)
VTTRFLIIGGGPAGNVAATHAARLGAEVVMVERDIVGGAAHLWDCIPSKSMIATGRAISRTRALRGMGLASVETDVDIDVESLTGRIQAIEHKMRDNVTDLLESQGVRIVHGTARFSGSHTAVVDGPDGSETIEFDMALVSTGSRPRIPDWCQPDGDRILTTRDCYPPKVFPESVTVVGSGVTGVEFVHMFSSFGAKVTLVVSRQQVLPGKDPEVAAVLEEEFMRRGVKLLMGARAEAMERSTLDDVDGDGDGVTVRCDDGRTVRSTHAVLAIGSIPNTADIGLEVAGVDVDSGGYVPINQHCVTNVAHIYAAGDISGKLPLSSVASMQGRKVAEHVMGLHTRSHRHLDYDKAASAIFTEPEIADVGLAEAEAFSSGRKIRVTKVPFSATAKAMINNDTQGFVKIISDPATGVVLGGSIVGRQAAELISVIAVAVTANLSVTDLAESILVHPALSEALAEAAE